jgi:hypothetical protein
MLWTFAITDRGDVCTDLSGTIKLLDPAGREIDPSGGTFIDRSSINMGQTLPKSASFSTLPRSGVLYEVDITVRCGYYSTDIYQPEHFQL